MANYDNGANTRKHILYTAMELFYERGFDAVTYKDICKAAYVNRSTLYYHFPSKDALCYEVLWEIYIQNKRIAEKYCKDPDYVYLVGLIIQWNQIQQDPAIRRLQREICISYPVFTGNLDATHFYTRLCEVLWTAFWDMKVIPAFSVASMYGYIISALRFLCEYPDNHNALELLKFSCNNCALIWGIPEETMNPIWEKAGYYFQKIPGAARKFTLSLNQL